MLRVSAAPNPPTLSEFPLQICSSASPFIIHSPPPPGRAVWLFGMRCSMMLGVSSRIRLDGGRVGRKIGDGTADTGKYTLRMEGKEPYQSHKGAAARILLTPGLLELLNKSGAFGADENPQLVRIPWCAVVLWCRSRWETVMGQVESDMSHILSFKEIIDSPSALCDNYWCSGVNYS